MNHLKLMIAGLYVVQGLPLGLAFQAYPTLLRDSGVSLDLIALVPIAGLPWVLKFLWAPFIDNHWFDKIGRRKSWLLIMQLGLFCILCILAFIPFNQDKFWLILLLALLSSLFCATQDIATDAVAAEQLPVTSLNQANTLQVGALIFGMLIGGPLALMGIEALGQILTILCLAGLVIVCIIPVLIWQEPTQIQYTDCKPASLKKFFKPKKSLLFLFFGTACTTGGAVIFALVKLILVDANWSISAIGMMSLVESLMMLGGCIIAYIATRFLNISSVLLLGLSMVFICSVLWIFMLVGMEQLNIRLVWLSVVLGGAGIGICSVASYSILMRFVQLGTQAGTDYATFQSSQVFGEILVSSMATSLAAQAGYRFSFIFPVLIVLIAASLLYRAHPFIKHIFHQDNSANIL